MSKLVGKKAKPLENAIVSKGLSYFRGGERGIRTLDTCYRIHTFQACAFNHSATSPQNEVRTILILHCWRNAVPHGEGRFLQAWCRSRLGPGLFAVWR